MVERGTVWQSQWRHPAALEIGLNIPIQKRYYFSGPYHSWHGSASWQDSHVPLIIARQNYSSAKLKQIVDQAAGAQPSHLSLVPIVLALLATEPTQAPATAPASAATPASPGTGPSATPAANLNEVAVGIADE